MEQNQKEYSKTEIATVPLKELSGMVDKLNQAIEDKDTLISVEFILATLFPKMLDNIMDFGTKKFIEGVNSVK